MDSDAKPDNLARVRFQTAPSIIARIANTAESATQKGSQDE
jgi:hypothetical protein